MCYSTITFYCGCTRKIHLDCRSPRFGCFSSLAKMAGSKTDCDRHRSTSTSPTTCGRKACEEVYPDAPRRSRKYRHHESSYTKGSSVTTAERVAPHHYVIPGSHGTSSGRYGHEKSREERHRRRRAEEKARQESDRQREERHAERSRAAHKERKTREGSRHRGSDKHRREESRHRGSDKHRDSDKHHRGESRHRGSDKHRREESRHCGSDKHRGSDKHSKNRHRSDKERSGKDHKKHEREHRSLEDGPSHHDFGAAQTQMQLEDDAAYAAQLAAEISVAGPSAQWGQQHMTDAELAAALQQEEEVMAAGTNDLRTFAGPQDFADYRNFYNFEYDFVSDQGHAGAAQPRINLDAEISATMAHVDQVTLGGQSGSPSTFMSGANYMLDGVADYKGKGTTRPPSAVPRALHTPSSRSSSGSASTHRHHKKSNSTSTSAHNVDIPERHSSKRHHSKRHSAQAIFPPSSAHEREDEKRRDSKSSHHHRHHGSSSSGSSSSKDKASKHTEKHGLQRIRDALGGTSGRKESIGSDSSFGCVDSNRIAAGAEARYGLYAGNTKRERSRYINGTDDVLYEGKYDGGRPEGNWI
ncbi:hypothetical protein BROUX41_004774 [Berkeleyomyces rouxiae]